MRFRMRRFLLAASFVFGAMLSSSAGDSKSAPTPKQIAQWVEQLADNDFEVRENASKQLWQAGAAAESALEKAAKSDDSEVARRARDLLDKFHWGIYPDTPADIVALIRAYQSSEGKPRMEVLQKLLEGGDAGLRAVVKIAAAEKDADRRRMLGELITSKLPSTFLLAVTESKYDAFVRLLELSHESKFVGHHSYAAYYLLRGQLPERIAHVTESLSGHPQDKWLAQTLVYLHRANGDLVQARKVAQKYDLSDLLEDILYDLGDWKALAARPNIALASDPVEKWSYRAAFARLAGQQDDFEKAVLELRKAAESKDQRQWRAFVAAKGLLLNDRPTDGLALLRSLPDRRDVLFDSLCARLEFAAALDLAKKDLPRDRLTPIPDLHLARARLLCLLGDKEGEALFDRFAERIKDEVDPRWVQSFLAEEMRAGLKDRAFAHAAKALSVAPPKHVPQIGEGSLEHLYFGKLFPQQAKTAEVWWAVLRRQFKKESPAAVMKRLRELLEGKAAAKDVQAWIETDRGYREPVPSSTIPLRQMQAWRQALAEGALLAGLDDLAISLLKKADSRDAFIRLGDLLASKKQWAKAAESYQQAWKKELLQEKQRAPRMSFDSLNGQETRDPLPLFLAGDALVRAGQEKEGKKRIEQAHWVPFADATARFNFFRALTQRGHKEAARGEIDFLIRLGEPTSLYAKEALRFRAYRDLKQKDYRKAADGFEQSMLNCLHAGIIYSLHDNYSYIPAQIHQLRALGLLAAGKFDEALKHIELALTDSPGYIDLPIALVPELERRGHKKEATDLFNRCYGTIEKVCRDYPRFASAHNSAAWMAACCRRNLDAALAHAQKAVELSPTHAGYHDTLAEVHFQRGDKDKAIALQKRVIELDPKRAYYRKQLKRLEAGDPTAERPPENDD